MPQARHNNETAWSEDVRLDAAVFQKESRFDFFRGNIFVCILINLLFLAAVLLIMRPVFESNDDINIAFFINRARPVQDPHLLFVNTIVGWVGAALYRITNMVPWYSALQYFGLFCAFTGMTWAIQKLFSRWSALVLAMFFLFFFAADAYTSLQFTKTAGVCSAAGLFLVVFAMTRKHGHRGALLFGCLIFAFFLDRDRFVVDGRCAAVLILIVLALHQNTWSKSWRHNTKKKEQKMTADANLVAQTSQDSEHLYLSKVGLYTLSTAYNPLSLVPVGAGANTCALGGWPAGSPSYPPAGRMTPGMRS